MDIKQYDLWTVNERRAKGEKILLQFQDRVSFTCNFYYPLAQWNQIALSDPMEMDVKWFNLIVLCSQTIKSL